jgi:sugar-specific transcriptional regulator TrmB
VYESIRVLESKGLVEVHHSNPKRFRALPIDDAIQLLRSKYHERFDRLHRMLESLEPADPE